MGSGQGQGRVHFSEFCCSSTLLSKPKQTFLSLTFPPPAAHICRHLSISACGICVKQIVNISTKKNCSWWKHKPEATFRVLQICKSLLQYLSKGQIIMSVRLRPIFNSYSTYLWSKQTLNCKNNEPSLCPIKAWWLVLIEPDCLLFPLLYCPPLMSWFPLRGVQAHALR